MPQRNLFLLIEVSSIQSASKHQMQARLIIKEIITIYNKSCANYMYPMSILLSFILWVLILQISNEHDNCKCNHCRGLSNKGMEELGS